MCIRALSRLISYSMLDAQSSLLNAPYIHTYIHTLFIAHLQLGRFLLPSSSSLSLSLSLFPLPSSAPMTPPYLPASLPIYPSLHILS